jgi:hypothetical protein
MVYYLFPETGFRSLEEVDVIFHAASQLPRPWLNVVKIAANEPLWYGRDGEESFNYEDSEWHHKHVRFSDEIKDSDGKTHTVNDSSNSTSGPDLGEIGRAVSSDENEKKDWLQDSSGRTDSDETPDSEDFPGYSRAYGRVSDDGDTHSRVRSAGRGA